jgi:hypothetical protein
MSGRAAACQDKAGSIVAEQLFSIFDEADQHNHSGPHQAEKEHDLDHPH